MPTYDIADVKARNPPGDVARRLGLEMRGNRLVCQHPDHADADSFNLAALDRAYRCHSGSCGRTYDVVDIVRFVRKCTFPEAVRWLADGSGVGPSTAFEPTSDGGRRAGGAIGARDRRFRPPRLEMMELLHEVAALYEAELWTWDGVKKSEGNPLALLRERVKDDTVIRHLRGGYSPGPDFLGDLLPISRHALAVEAGLLSGKKGGDGDWKRALATRVLSDRPGRDLTAGRTILWEYRHVRLPGGNVGRLPVWADRRLVVEPPAWVAKDKRPPKYLGLALPRPLLGFDDAYGKGPYIIVVEGLFKALAAQRIGYPAVATGSSMFGDDIAGELRLLMEAATILAVCDRDGGAEDEKHPLPGPGRLGPGHKGFAHSFRKMRLEWQRVVFVRSPVAHKGFDDFADAEPAARAVFDERMGAAVRYARGRHAAPRHGPRAAADRNGHRYSPPASYTQSQLDLLWRARRAEKSRASVAAGTAAIDWWLAVLFDVPGGDPATWPATIILPNGAPVPQAVARRFVEAIAPLVSEDLARDKRATLVVAGEPSGHLATVAAAAKLPDEAGVWPPDTTMDITPGRVRVRIGQGRWMQIYPDNV